MVYLLGLCCVAWTIVELVRLSRETNALAREARETTELAREGAPARSRPRSASVPKRVPLAAWDDQGRPIFVEDVSLRGRR